MYTCVCIYTLIRQEDDQLYHSPWFQSYLYFYIKDKCIQVLSSPLLHQKCWHLCYHHSLYVHIWNKASVLNFYSNFILLNIYSTNDLDGTKNPVILQTHTNTRLHADTARGKSEISLLNCKKGVMFKNKTTFLPQHTPRFVILKSYKTNFSIIQKEVITSLTAVVS